MTGWQNWALAARYLEQELKRRPADAGFRHGKFTSSLRRQNRPDVAKDIRKTRHNVDIKLT